MWHVNVLWVTVLVLTPNTQPSEAGKQIWYTAILETSNMNKPAH